MRGPDAGDRHVASIRYGRCSSTTRYPDGVCTYESIDGGASMCLNPKHAMYSVDQSAIWKASQTKTS